MRKTIIICLLTLISVTLWGARPDTVKLRLRWKHQFQYAGYYAAIEKGFYRDAGLDVHLVEPVDGEDPSRAVFDKKADFGIGTTDVLMMKASGESPVILASVFQHSPQILIASVKSGIDNINDLTGKKVAIEPNAADLIALMKTQEISLNDFRLISHDYNLTEFLSGEIDAISAYSSDELFELRQYNFEYVTFSPIQAGIDFYGEVLFTSREYLEANPDLAGRFREASLKGWQYAMEHTDEMVQLIFARYSKRHSIPHLKYEAEQMKWMILPEVVEIGYSNPKRWNAILKTYQDLGLIDSSVSTKGLLYEEYSKKEHPVTLGSVFALLGIFTVIAAIVYFVVNANRRLRLEIKKKNTIETELRESEEKYRTLVEAMSDGVYRSTHDGRFVEVNPALVRILGYDSKEELLSIDIKTQLYFAEEERESADLVQKQEEMAVFRLRKKDGSEIWVEDHGRHILDEAGNIKYHEGALRDVTERKLIQDELARSEERYRTLVENMGEGVGYTDTEEEFVYANPSAERIFGVEPGMLTGKSLWSFILPDQAEFIKAETNKRTNGKSSVFEIRIVSEDRKEKTLLITATPSFMHGKFSGTFAIFRDITERKQDEEEIRKKNEELHILNVTKDKFFSIIAHDLKSPFNTIVGFSELLIENIKSKDYEEIEKYAGIILESSERAMELLMNLMEWAMTQTGRLEYKPELLNISVLLKDLMKSFIDAAGQKSISLKVIYPEGIEALADRQMLSTVLRNLISNAIKFTRTGGEIIVKAEVLSGEICISVKDNGVGIPEQALSKLFRIDQNYTTKGTNMEKGTGLGLILCREFVVKHGGRIWVESQPNKGSTFSFTLPVHSIQI